MTPGGGIRKRVLINGIYVPVPVGGLCGYCRAGQISEWGESRGEGNGLARPNACPCCSGRGNHKESQPQLPLQCDTKKKEYGLDG